MITNIMSSPCHEPSLTSNHHDSAHLAPRRSSAGFICGISLQATKGVDVAKEMEGMKAARLVVAGLRRGSQLGMS